MSSPENGQNEPLPPVPAQSVDSGKAQPTVPILEALNPKQRLFLSLVLEGKKTPEAYRQAGYEGDDHAAYTLKTRLNKALAALAEARGMTRADLMVQIQNMMEMPLIRVTSFGQAVPVDGITVDQWIKMAHLKEKILPDRKERPNITAIQINLGEDKPKGPDPIDV